MKFKAIKRIIYTAWILIVVLLIALFAIFPDVLTAENIYAFISEYERSVWVAYLLISFVSGFFVLPSTPFVLSGILLFPGQPVLVLVVSMTAILMSASVLYFFSDIIGISKYLEEKFPKKISTIKNKMTGRKSFFFVFAWSLIPFFPTDIICYVAGILKLNYWRLITAVFLGETIINSLYVFGGVEVIRQWLAGG